MKKVKKEKILEYTVLFEAAPEGGYVVTVPKLYGLTTEGDTFEEAKMMAEDAIKGYVESLAEHGKDVPVEDAQQVVNMKIRVSAPRFSKFVPA